MNAKGTLRSEFDSGGLAAIGVSGAATLDDVALLAAPGPEPARA